MANELFIEISAEQQEIVAGGSGSVFSATDYNLGILVEKASVQQISGGFTSSGPLGSTAVQPSSFKAASELLKVKVGTSAISGGSFL